MLNRLFIRHPTKTAYDKISQSGVYYFYQPLIYFYLIDVSFFVYIFPLAKCRSKVNMDKTLEDVEGIDFLILRARLHEARSGLKSV